jgi:hypothetical protein
VHCRVVGNCSESCSVRDTVTNDSGVTSLACLSLTYDVSWFIQEKVRGKVTICAVGVTYKLRLLQNYDSFGKIQKLLPPHLKICLF